jgi:hypothetical protein
VLENCDRKLRELAKARLGETPNQTREMKVLPGGEFDASD